MNNLPSRLPLLALAGTVIVLTSSFSSAADDHAAFRALAKRVLVFPVGCIVIAILMLIPEHAVASAC